MAVEVAGFVARVNLALKPSRLQLADKLVHAFSLIALHPAGNRLTINGMENEQLPQSPPAGMPAPQPYASPQSKKPWLWPVVIAATVIILAVVGMTFWANGQKKQFATSAVTYEKRMTETFKAIDGQPANTAEYIKFLEKHSSALSKTIEAQPKQSKLLWIKAAPEDSAKRVDDLSKAAGELKTAMQNYRLFLIYRDGVLEAVRSSGGTISTPDQMRATKSRLEAAHKSIKELTPPPGLESNKQKYVSSYDKPIATMKAALEAYDKGDASTYTNKVLQLAEEVKAISLPKTVAELMDMHQHYEAMNKAYDALDKLLPN